MLFLGSGRSMFLLVSTTKAGQAAIRLKVLGLRWSKSASKDGAPAQQNTTDDAGVRTYRVNCAVFRREVPFQFIVVSNLFERMTRLYLSFDSFASFRDGITNPKQSCHGSSGNSDEFLLS